MSELPSATGIPLNALTMERVREAMEKQTDMKIRYVIVLECKAPKSRRQAPEFSVGGRMAKKFPRDLPISELKEINNLNSNDIDISNGWAKVHHFIYVLKEDRDDQGWEYRSDWSEGAPGEEQEPWRKNRINESDVQRREWIMTVVSPAEKVSHAKKLISDYLRDVVKEPRRLFHDDVRRKESGMFLGVAWNPRHMVLWEDRVEIFTNAKACSDAEKKISAQRAAGQAGPVLLEGKLCDIPLGFVKFSRMFGPQVGLEDSSNYIFSLRDKRSDDSFCILNFADEQYRRPPATAQDKSLQVSVMADELRRWRKWSAALTYHIAIRTPNLDFPPFDYGPYSDDMPTSKVLIFGNLEKLGQFRENWKRRFFTCTSFTLHYYKGEEMMGHIDLNGAEVLPLEGSEDEQLKSRELAIRSSTGRVLRMRADEPNRIRIWRKVISDQLAELERVKRKTILKQAAIEAKATAASNRKAAKSAGDLDSSATAAASTLAAVDESADETFGDVKAPATIEPAAAAPDSQKESPPVISFSLSLPVVEDAAAAGPAAIVPTLAMAALEIAAPVPSLSSSISPFAASADAAPHVLLTTAVFSEPVTTPAPTLALASAHATEEASGLKETFADRDDDEVEAEPHETFRDSLVFIPGDGFSPDTLVNSIEDMQDFALATKTAAQSVVTEETTALAYLSPPEYGGGDEQGVTGIPAAVSNSIPKKYLQRRDSAVVQTILKFESMANNDKVPADLGGSSKFK